MKKIILISSIVVLVLGLTGCKKDFLETIPTESTSTKLSMSTLDGCMAAVNGIHRLMYSSVSYLGNTRQSAGGQSMLYIIADHMGEDFVAHAAGNGWFNSSYQWADHRNEANTDNAYQYAYLYQIIGNANLVLDYIDDVPDENKPDYKKIIKAEALCYRAFAHFWAVQMYAKRYDWAGNNSQLGVPLMTTFTTEPQPRSTVEEVYTQINKDLDSAIVHFTGNGQVSGLKSHFNLNVANGLKARVALTQGKWLDASKYAKEARKGKVLADARQLQDGFYTISNPEWIWASHQQQDQTTYFYSFFAYNSMNFGSSYIKTGPRKINAELYESMDPNDIRRNWWHSKETAQLNTAYPNLKANSFTLVKYGIYKFRVNGTNTMASSSVGDLVHMRTSEMYLIEAEAEARLGNDGLAQIALTAIMSIRVPGYTANNTGDALLDEIMTNRRIELWGEGFRWLDLKRTASTLIRTAAQGHQSNLCNGAVTMTAQGIAPDNNRWVYVFPRREKNSNPKLVQNP